MVASRFNSHILKDSIQVQSIHDYVNDDEKHEEHPHLEDFLILRRSVHIETEEEKKEKEKKEDPSSKSKRRLPLARPCSSILHKADCASRLPCEETEARRNVNFDSVIVREYGMILGDHPCCRFGLPVMLDWDYFEYDPLLVNDYEFHHSLRRPVKKLRLHSSKRKKLIDMAETSQKDLVACRKMLNRIQRRRSLTLALDAYAPLETAMESAIRKFKRALVGDHWKKEKHLYRRSSI